MKTDKYIQCHVVIGTTQAVHYIISINAAYIQFRIHSSVFHIKVTKISIIL